MKLQASTIKTAASEFHIIMDNNVVRASGFGKLSELKKRLPEEFTKAEFETINNHPYARLIENYFNGNVGALDKIPRHQTGSDFYQNVWQAMSRIKPGQTLNYKQLAKKSNYPIAIRAAGSACGQNRLCLLIPCHRIIKSDGSLGNYLYGSKIKRWLLEHEASYTKVNPARPISIK